jgi:hypothetical protein
MSVTKLYCFVDETGQDTKGELFLVVVVLNEINNLPYLEKQLDYIEQKTGKNHLKWKKTNKKIKEQYLEELIQVKDLRNSIYFSQYHASKEYSKLTSLTIAKTVLAQGYDNYSVTVIIDGINFPRPYGRGVN